MNIKVRTRSIIIWNMAIFLVMSFVFLHVQIALIREISALNLSLIRLNLFNLKEILVVISLAIYSVLNLKKWSRFAFFLAVTSVMGFTIFLLQDNFSKIILVTLGFYLTIAYYFYQFLIYELEEACYNPSFDNSFLFAPMLKKVPVTITLNEKKYQGHLTNWNEGTSFIYLNETIEIIKSEKALCEIEFCERIFKAHAEVAAITSDKKAIGLRFTEPNEEIFNWKSFYTITEQQGITAELIK